MHLPCFSGPMKTHLLDRHQIQTGEQMSCCSVICAFVLYSETQGTGHTHKHTQFKLKCIFLTKIMLKERKTIQRIDVIFPARNFLVSSQNIKWNFKLFFRVTNIWQEGTGLGRLLIYYPGYTPTVRKGSFMREGALSNPLACPRWASSVPGTQEEFSNLCSVNWWRRFQNHMNIYL